jgi:hypothetical protein
LESPNPVTLSFAVIGAVLGVINTWNAINLRRVRLTVIPSCVLSQGQNFVKTSSAEYRPGAMIGIEVVNMSAFPVTVKSVGFTLRGKKQFITTPLPLLVGLQEWPRKLNPHESVTGYMHPNTELPPTLGRAFAVTTSGILCYGSSPALKEMRA